RRRKRKVPPKALSQNSTPQKSLLLARLQILGQPLKPHHQRRVPLNLDVLVLNPLHERQLLVLRRHGRVRVGGILEAQRKSRLDRGTALAGNALVLDDEMPSHLAIQRMQLKGQVLVT